MEAFKLFVFCIKFAATIRILVKQEWIFSLWLPSDSEWALAVPIDLSVASYDLAVAYFNDNESLMVVTLLVELFCNVVLINFTPKILPFGLSMLWETIIAVLKMFALAEVKVFADGHAFGQQIQNTVSAFVVFDDGSLKQFPDLNVVFIVGLYYLEAFDKSMGHWVVAIRYLWIHEYKRGCALCGLNQLLIIIGDRMTMLMILFDIVPIITLAALLFIIKLECQVLLLVALNEWPCSVRVPFNRLSVKKS